MRGDLVVLGAGGTARAAVVAAAGLGAGTVTVVARDPAKAEPLLELAAATGVDGRWRAFTYLDLAGFVVAAGAVVSTIPAEVAAGYLAALRGPLAAPLDAIYEPWPSPLAAAVGEAGGRVIDGLQMLLHQAFAQVEQFTGRPAPKEAMAAALR